MALKASRVEMPDLSGQVAVVTGASRGIGKALSLRLAEAGVEVVVVAKSEVGREGLPGSIHDTVAEIEAAGGKARALRANLRHEADVQRMIEETLQQCGRIDILINNAGALFMAPVGATPMKRFDLVHQVNARAPFQAAQMCLEPMARQGGGHIINLSPPIEPEILPGKVAYCMSKFGMSLLTLGLGPEVAAQGICVASLWPATIVESQASINHKMGTPDMWRGPEVLADALIALLSQPKDEINGRIWLDEELLARCGVDDLAPYSVVEGGTPLRIVGAGNWMAPSGQKG